MRTRRIRVESLIEAEARREPGPAVRELLFDTGDDDYPRTFWRRHIGTRQAMSSSVSMIWRAWPGAQQRQASKQNVIPGTCH